MIIIIDDEDYVNPYYLIINIGNKIQIDSKIYNKRYEGSDGVINILNCNYNKFLIENVRLYNIYCNYYTISTHWYIMSEIYIFINDSINGHYTYIKKEYIHNMYDEFTSNFVINIYDRMTTKYQFFYFFLMQRLIYNYIYDDYKINGKYYKFIDVYKYKTFKNIKNMYNLYYYKINIYI